MPPKSHLIALLSAALISAALCAVPVMARDGDVIRQRRLQRQSAIGS